MRRFILYLMFFSCASSFAQQDSIQKIKEVTAADVTLGISVPKRTWDQADEEMIQELQPTDASEIIQKFAGTSIKSYGGLGGLKTVSSRGLGASHSAIVVDGQTVQNSQSGQVNLGQIQGDNLVSVSTFSGKHVRFTLPISSQVAGSQILLQTFENKFDQKGFQLRSNFKYGSFNQQNLYLGIKHSSKKWLLSALGTYRNADGNYDYSVNNGLQTIEGERQNNDYNEFSFGGTVGYRSDKFLVKAAYRQQEIDQGLPGAIVFYNQTQNERLRTWKKNAFIDIWYKSDQWLVKGYVNGILTNERYSDPDYLNTQGSLVIDYQNRGTNIGVSTVFFPKNKKLILFGGVEQGFSDLIVNQNDFALPVRFHNYGLLGGEYTVKNKIKFKVQISEQYIAERNNNGINANDRFRVNPYVSMETTPGNRQLRHALWYRNSFRMPSFNELYYNNIGNTSLIPEDAHQVNYGISIVPVDAYGFGMQVRSNVYVNFVNNKIIAIPTKNLFVWSMQNIGKVNVYGFEAIVNAQMGKKNKWHGGLDANYSYQRTLDYTDKESVTYRHQVAYVPVHTANFDLSVYYRKTGLRISNHYTSMRYSLNENIELNEVSAFLITDASIFHRFILKKKHQLALQFTVKNMFNQSYAYIRSFVMPGRNYLISLSYALN